MLKHKEEQTIRDYQIKYGKEEMLKLVSMDLPNRNIGDDRSIGTLGTSSKVSNLFKVAFSESRTGAPLLATALTSSLLQELQDLFL